MHLYRPFLIGLSCGLAWLSGCASNPNIANPSFPVDMKQAEVLLEQMHAQPKPLIRPVVVIGGIDDPGFQSSSMAGEIRHVTTANAPVLHITCALDGSFARCAKRVINDVNQAYPEHPADQTIEVDVVGFSMGGLVARFAASDESAAKLGCRLNIKRLFTVSSPHRGANLAVVPTFDKRVIDMRHDSDFLKRLNGESRDYELIPYARLGDMVVGEENAAPPGQNVWWLPKAGLGSHLMACHDARIVADIGRRLRDEPPLTIEPAAPLLERVESRPRPPSTGPDRMSHQVAGLFRITKGAFRRIVLSADEFCRL